MELATLAALSSLAAGGVAAVGSIAAGEAQADYLQQQGHAQQQAAEFEAKQLDINAKNEQATAQRQMLQLRRQKKLALSSLQARAAGSGFTATDPTSLSIADEIEKYGTYQEQAAMYGGRQAATDLNLSAAGRRFSGSQALNNAYTQASLTQGNSMFSAAGSILGGISGFADRYGRRTPPPTTAGRYG